jgi:P pilus assembly chaperone PapD
MSMSWKSTFTPSFSARRNLNATCLGALAVLLGLALSSLPAQAQGGAGDLLVAPTRIVLEGRTRSAEVTLINTGAEAATYRVSFVNLRMDEEGGTREITAAEALPGEQFSEGLIRYSPRQVTLDPRVAQTVRMQVRLPADLPAGEYRSHLLFRAVPPAAEIPDSPGEAKGLSIQLIPIYGVAIPVIVRHGETTATVTLSELELVGSATADAGLALRFWIRRAGNRSIHGNLTATFVPAAGEPVVVGRANGVAVYTPNPARHATMVLHPPPGLLLQHGRLHLTYSQQGDAGATLAEADLQVP